MLMHLGSLLEYFFQRVKAAIFLTVILLGKSSQTIQSRSGKIIFSYKKYSRYLFKNFRIP